jgi:hypothetical protein
VIIVQRAFRKIASVRGVALTLVLVASAAFGTVAVADTMSALVAWAENASPQKVVTMGEFGEVPTTVVDEFKPGPAGGRRGEWGLGAHGTFLETPEAGSTWVYDYAHHIAAESQYGGFQASIIFYAAPPPSKITSRDLSAVTSERGLKLGMSPQQAAHDFAVPITSVTAVKMGGKVVPHYTVLSVNKLCPKPQMCGHGAIVFFEDNRAVAIEVGIAGP